MKNKDTIEVEGEVQNTLPNALFSVKLDNGHELHATLGGRLRQNRINIMPGDRVVVNVSIYDWKKGRITYRK
jgi:translation initiation factor IF-1